MTEPNNSAPARVMATNIEKLLEFADQQQDFLLGAKLADAQAILLERYFPSEPA